MCRLDFEGMSRDAVRARAEREREEESLEDMASGGGDPDFMTVSCFVRSQSNVWIFDETCRPCSYQALISDYFVTRIDRGTT